MFSLGAILGLIVLCVGLYLMHIDKQRAIRDDLTSFLRGENGRLEYLMSWYVFWNDVVPEIYDVCNKKYKKTICVYDPEFEHVGYELYGYEPAVEALQRSMAYMTSIGRTHYVNYAEDERWFHHYRRPDLIYRPFPVTSSVGNKGCPRLDEPLESDARREFCVCSDGITRIPLKEAHIPYRRCTECH